jgi:RimJ/RimL family protein N-acetyltransferase
MIRAWRNDYKVWRWCRQNDFISDIEQVRWFERQAADPSIKMYKIVVKFENLAEDKSKIVTVGVCGLTSIDYINRRGEFSLYIAPAFQGNNFGRQALCCLLTHGFLNLGMHSIYGETFDGNPAIKMFESLGFRKEGTRREFYFRDGGFIDAHLYSMTEGEWKRYNQQSL